MEEYLVATTQGEASGCFYPDEPEYENFDE
jgi:hypothetical protein